MIDILSFSSELAAGIATATGIECVTDGDTDIVNGEFNDCIILSLGGTDELIQGNQTCRISYRIGYAFLPESMTASAMQAKHAEIMDDIATYISSFDKYDEFGGAVILDASIYPWEVTYSGQQISYNMPLEFVVQL